MTRGRKPKPIASQEKKRRVHRSNEEKEARRARETALATASDDMKAPVYLTTKKLRERFNEIVALMLSVDGFPCTDLDADAIARYVLEEEEYLAASKSLRRARSSNDYVVIGACQRMKNSAFKCVDTAAKAIGLTIDSRLRFDIKKEEEKPKSKFADLDE